MKRFFLLLIMALGVLSLSAQAPEAFKYQAVARNADGSVLANKLVNFRISILVESVTGTVVYSEQHLKTTNPFGLVDMEIGKGTSPVGTFVSVAWGTGNYFVKVEMDPSGGTSFQHVGTSQLLSVPYALHAKTAQTTAESSSFVNLAGNQTITGAKVFSKDILVTGGITVGSGKRVDTSNTALGASALASDTEGHYNTAVGANALKFNTIGSDNTATGFMTLQSNTEGNGNSAFGDISLYFNTKGNYNTALGREALYSNTTGSYNTAVGLQALFSNTNGSDNTGLGFAAGRYAGTGSIENTSFTRSLFLGSQTRPLNIGQTNQIVIGYNAVGNGSNSVVLGNDEILTTILKGKVGIGKKDPAVALDVVGQVSVNDNRITSVASPVDAKDAVNKAYVDALEQNVNNLAWILEDPSNRGLAKDIEGNEYKTVVIGTQTWMADNLKTTTYNDGTPIPNVTDNAAWAALSTPAYCWYNNNVQYKNPYGALYNWYAVNTQKLCPSGWHVASVEEWNTLIDYLGGSSIAGGKLKEAGTEHWQSPNTGATNESGFTGVPNGQRYPTNGDFVDFGITGLYLTSSMYSSNEIHMRSLQHDQTYVYINSGANPKVGYAIRCIKD